MKSTLTRLILAGCVLMLFLSCNTEMPVTSQQDENTGSSSALSKKPDGVGGTWIGTATLADNEMLISSDGNGEYIDCRKGGYGYDKVELEIDVKDQLARVEIFCGQHCQFGACPDPSSRTVEMDLQGGTPEEPLSEAGAALLAAIAGATGEQVYIQFWPVSKNNWTSLITCMASSVTRGDLVDVSDIEKYKFWGGPDDCIVGGDDDPLMFGVKHMNVDVIPSGDKTWIIQPSAVQDEPVRVYVMKKRNPKNKFWEPEFLANYGSGLPFEITVHAEQLRPE